MSEEQVKVITLLEGDDYARSPVPEDKRKSWVSTAAVYIGSCICLSAFMLGGTLATGLSLGNAIIATLVGTAVLAVMTCVCSTVALHNHLSTSMIARFTFGIRGAAIVGLMYALCAWGWFGVQVGLFADSVAAIINMWTGATVSGGAIKVIILIGGILMTSSAIIGYKSIERLSLIAIPLLAILMVVATVKACSNGLVDMGVKEPITMGFAISYVISSYIAGAVGSPDVMRYGRNMRDTVLSVVFGLVVGYGTAIILALICAKAAGEANIVYVMINLGMGVLAMVVLILAQWTSNDNNIYSASLGFSVVFEKMPKYQLAIIAGVVGTLFAVFGISNNLIWLFSILGIFTPPIGGVYVADFFLDRKYYDFENLKNVPRFRPETLAAYFIASAVGFVTTYTSVQLTSIPALDTLLCALILEFIFVQAFNKDHTKGIY